MNFAYALLFASSLIFVGCKTPSDTPHQSEVAQNQTEQQTKDSATLQGRTYFQPESPQYTLPQLYAALELDYIHLLDTPMVDTIPVSIRVKSQSAMEKFIEGGSSMHAMLTYANQKHSKKIFTKYLAVGVSGTKGNYSVHINLNGLEKSSYYIFDVQFFEGDLDQTTAQISQHNRSIAAIRNLKAVTSGDSKLEKAQHRIATIALLEAYYWEFGRRNQNSYGYCRGGWCGLFPLYCQKSVVKVFSENPSNSYATWGKMGNFNLSNLESIIGFWGWKESHKFMFLAYDQDTQKYLTVEGNLGSRVAFNKRSQSKVTGVGILSEEMLWENINTENKFSPGPHFIAQDR